MQVNSQNLQLFFEGGSTAFNEAFRTADTRWPNFAMPVPTSGEAETYAWFGQFPRLEEWVGTRVYQRLLTHRYTITNIDYQSTITLTRNQVLADKMGMFSILSAELGAAAAALPDERLATLIKQGNRMTCYDGQYFFDTDHPVDGQANVSNLDGDNASDIKWMLVGTSGSSRVLPFVWQNWQPYDMYSIEDLWNEQMLRAIKEFHFGTDGSSAAGYGLWQLAYGSTNAITTAKFETAYAAMQKFMGEGGRPLAIRPRRLIVAPDQRAAAMKIMQPLVNGGESNPNANLVDVVVNEYL